MTKSSNHNPNRKEKYSRQKAIVEKHREERKAKHKKAHPNDVK